VKLGPLLGDCDLAITHGGHGTLAALLLSGTPMLLIPTQIEQMLLSQRMQRAGIGLALSPGEVTSHFDHALTRMLSGAEFTWRAKALATNHAAYDQQKTVECIISALEELPARQG
jgi:UDP:flavonoid glycosyltransferase YjiC (YdhE family)